MDAGLYRGDGPGGRVGRARVHAALGDPTRLAIVDAVHLGDASPQALATRLQVAPNLLAHHLRVLESAGVVRRVVSEGDRRRTYVQAVPGILDSLVAPVAARAVAARVVFVCTRNSARSVLAAALWVRASDVPAASAGTAPATTIHPGTVAAASRLRLDLGDVRPRHVDDVLGLGDLVVSTCDGAGEELARDPRQAPPGIHWSIADPVPDGSEAAFDGAVRDLGWRVARLAATIRPG